MTIKSSPFKMMIVNTSGLTTVDPINYPVDRNVSKAQGVAIPRRCNINIAEAHRLVAEAKAFNAKIAAEAAAIRNS